MFSFRFWSEEANAVISPPTWRSLLIPTPPLTTTAPVDLLVEFVVDWTARVPDTVVASLVALPRVTLPVALKIPTTFKSSLISTDPEELILRFPDLVSIVLSSVCAILILPNSTAPPLNVPDTDKLPPMNTFFAIPTPPDTIREPVAVSYTHLTLPTKA